MNIPFADIAAQNRQLKPELEEAMFEVIERGNFILGEQVQRFEEAWAAYCRKRYCVGVGCGLDALVLLLRAHGIGAGDEVLVASNTYVATWLAVTHVGAKPVPVEPSPESMNMEPLWVQLGFTKRTRAILVTHLYGRSAEMEELAYWARAQGVPLLVDAAQAHGVTAENNGLGDGAAFSFYPTKNLGAMGDGGAVVTNDKVIADKVRKLRNYGSAIKNWHEVIGFNSRLDELQAAVLNIKLQRLDEWNAKRTRNARIYHSLLGVVSGLVLPLQMSGKNVWHLYVIRLHNRDALKAWLKENGVDTQIHYPTPPHQQPAYMAQHCAPQPNAERMAATALSLPVGPELEERDVVHVASLISEFMNAERKAA